MELGLPITCYCPMCKHPTVVTAKPESLIPTMSKMYKSMEVTPTTYRGVANCDECNSPIVAILTVASMEK